MNKKKWIIVTIIILIVTNVISLFTGGLISYVLPLGRTLVTKADVDRLNEVNKLFQIKDALYKKYDGTISESDLMTGAIKGMVSALNDPYTVYMDKKEYDAFNTETEGSYSGVGLQVEAVDEKIIVTSVFDGSPAKKAGLLPNDQILKVNGTAVSGKDLDGAVTLMKGKEGTSVTITMYRASKGQFDVKINRQKITMNTVSGEMLSNNVGYISISMFDENTGNNFNKELKTLKDKGMKGLILDLRDNPGGLLTACQDVTSNFVKKGNLIVSTVDKYNNKELTNSKGGIAIGMPLVVLVNGNTASASEIFSGAVRDYKLGTLIGEKTFGKGIVQQIFPDPSDGTALKVTVSKYYTPDGENIHHKGINPDIVVKYPDNLLQKPYDRSLDPQFKKALEVINSKIK